MQHWLLPLGYSPNDISWQQEKAVVPEGLVVDSWVQEITIGAQLQPQPLSLPFPPSPPPPPPGLG